MEFTDKGYGEITMLDHTINSVGYPPVSCRLEPAPFTPRLLTMEEILEPATRIIESTHGTSKHESFILLYQKFLSSTSRRS